MTSNIKAKINIEKALQQLSKLDDLSKYQQRDNALCEINGNIQLPSKQFIPNKSRQQDPFKSKEFSIKSKESLASSKSKAKIYDKENEQTIGKSDSVGTSYAAISRTIEQKNTTIDQQKRYIETLKKTIHDLKKNKENCTIEEGRVRSQELTKLKNKEREHIQNIKEIKVLKSNLQEIRRRYQQILAQKNASHLKYDNLLSQNQQLTISIAHLKLQMQNTSRSNNGIQFQQQIIMLKQQLKKQYMQKQAIQARALNFERRMNEYVLKFGEAQQQFNDCQIKYYKLQNDYDNVRVDKEQSEIRYSSLFKQSKAEKQLHQAQVTKVKAKLKQSESIISQLQNDIFQITEAQKRKMNEPQPHKNDIILKQTKEEVNKLRLQLHNSSKKWEYQNKQLIDKFAFEKQGLIEQNRTLRNNLHHLSLQNDEFLKKQEWILRNNKDTEMKIAQLQAQLHSKTQKNHSLMRDIQLHQSQICGLKNYIEKMEEQNALKLESLQRHESIIQLQYKEKQQQKNKIMTKINCLQARLSQENELLNQRQSILISQNSSLSLQLQKLNEQTAIKIHSLEQTINDLNKSIRQKDEEIGAVHFICEQIKKEKCMYYDRQKKIIEQINNEKRYYQQKYERQLQEYNSLSKSFNDIEMQNAELLKKNSQNIIDISNLRNQIILVKQELNLAYQKNDSISYRQDQIQIIHEQVQKLRQQCQNLCEELETKTNKVEQLTSEKEHLGKQIETLRFQNRELSNSIKIIQYRNLELEQIESKQSKQLQVMSTIVNEAHCMATKWKQQVIEKENAIIKIKTQLSLQMQTVQKLNKNIQIIQAKYSDLAQQHSFQLVHWQQQRLQLQHQWVILNEASQQEKRALNNSRMSASYELDSTQNAINILRHENIQLQRIFGQEIERRNQTIRQLIKQKKALYDQLVGSKHD